MRSSGGLAGESGVLFMDMIAEIRRRHLVSKESISSIARDLKLSRPTVRKHCRTQSEPVYQRHKQPTPMLVLRLNRMVQEADRALPGSTRQMQSKRTALAQCCALPDID